MKYKNWEDNLKKILSILLFTSFLLGNTKTVAISYFDNTSGLEKYNPLSKGLADMLITDLSNVQSMRLVEIAPPKATFYYISP